MPQTATTDPTGASSIAGYSPIHPNVLRLLDRVDVNLYVLPDGAEFPVLLREAGLEVTAEQIKELASDKSRRVFVQDGDFKNFTDKLLGSLDRLVEDDSMPVDERFSLLQVAAAAEVEHACTLLNPNKYVSLSKKLGGNLATLIESDDVVPAELFRTARHDYRTFAHVTNVACYASVLADQLGIRDEAERREIAVGAMLHDLGKRLIPGEILRKPGRLNAEERQVVERHPLDGYIELRTREDVSRRQLMMVYQHHERMDGGGYPVGVAGDEIHPWARLVAVVDVFDAMTGSRPYRAPAKPREALEFIEDNAGTHFDKEMVRCWAMAMAEI